MFGFYPIGEPYFADAPMDDNTNHPVIVTPVWDDSPCKVMACDNPPDIPIYSLQDALAFNTTPLSFVVNCPAGYICAPGEFPKTITFPPGTITIPPPDINPGFPTVISGQGCSSVVSITLPSTATAAQIAAAQQSVIFQLAQQQAQCDAIAQVNPSPSPGFLNATVYFVVACPVGTTLTFTGAFPSWITLDAGHGRLIGAAGVFGGSTQAGATATAQAQLNDFANSAITSDQLTCQGPASFPDYAFTSLFGNADALVTATINGYNFLAGQPTDGTLMGSSLANIWTTQFTGGGYAIAYQAEDAVAAGEEGTYRFTIDNTTLVPFTLDQPQVVINVNGLAAATYLLDSTTGPMSYDIPLIAGDIVDVLFSADGQITAVGSFSTSITTVKL